MEIVDLGVIRDLDMLYGDFVENDIGTIRSHAD